MDAALKLVQSLGINASVWTQLFIFLVTFTALYFIVFKPYFTAHFERHARTTGGREDTSHLLVSNQVLQLEYETKARDVNDKVRLVFEKAKNEALTEQSNILTRARESATNQLRISREKLDRELQVARQQLQQEVKEIGVIVANKLIGADKASNGHEARQ